MSESMVMIPECLNQPQATAWGIVGFLGDIEGATLLDPCAGIGAIANAAREYGAIVTCIEGTSLGVKTLMGLGHNVYSLDFLRIKPAWLGADWTDQTFDYIALDCPRLDRAKYLAKAFNEFLKRGGKLVCVKEAKGDSETDIFLQVHGAKLEMEFVDFERRLPMQIYTLVK